MTTLPGFPPVPLGGGLIKKLGEAASISWVKRIAEVLNNVLKGKINVVLQVTLRASETTTSVVDARIGPFSALILQPLTADAAAALYSATSVLPDPTTQLQGSVTLNHPSNAAVDQTFNLVILA